MDKNVNITSAWQHYSQRRHSLPCGVEASVLDAVAHGDQAQ